MATIKLTPKNPDEVIDYDIDVSRWLGGGDTINDATAEAIGVNVDAIQIHGTIVKAWLSGGEKNTMSETTITLTTAAGRVKQITLLLRIGAC